MFGGSNLWGPGAPDDQTIPSVLSREYARLFGPVCVTNFGEGAWVSTQNVIQLELALKHASRPPDFVLFYDGPADIAEVDQSGNADVHANFERIRQRVEVGRTKRSQLAYLKETGTYRLIGIIMNQVASSTSSSAPAGKRSRNLDNLAKMTVENYRANMKVVESLSAEYGFQYISFWSPWILIGNKPLCSPERSILDSITKATPYLPELSRETYDMMFSVPDPHIINLSDTFDLTTSDTYLDRGHVTPDGNRVVALRMLEDLKKSGKAPALTH
jgi:lysophospholipase L1-like esterase